MIIYPAIDLKDGKCVRLRKGEFDTVHQVADSAVEMAVSFKNTGAKWMHTVDLDGSLQKKPVNNELILSMKQNSGLLVQVGGGIRCMNDVEYYLNNGIDRVIIGSAAINDKTFVEAAVKLYSDEIAVGIDAKNGMAAANGWLDTSEVDYIDLAKTMEQIGVRTIIYTDISRDGMLSGADLEGLNRLNKAVSCDIIASGGVKDINDIRNIKAMNISGAICGKSLYEGTLGLAEALKVAAYE